MSFTITPVDAQIPTVPRTSLLRTRRGIALWECGDYRSRFAKRKHFVTQRVSLRMSMRRPDDCAKTLTSRRRTADDDCRNQRIWPDLRRTHSSEVANRRITCVSETPAMSKFKTSAKRVES